MINLRYNKKKMNFEVLLFSKLFFFINSKKSIVEFVSNISYNYIYFTKVLRSLGLIIKNKNKNDYYN